MNNFKIIGGNFMFKESNSLVKKGCKIEIEVIAIKERE